MFVCCLGHVFRANWPVGRGDRLEVESGCAMYTETPLWEWPLLNQCIHLCRQATHGHILIHRYFHHQRTSGQGGGPTQVSDIFKKECLIILIMKPDFHSLATNWLHSRLQPLIGYYLGALLFVGVLVERLFSGPNFFWSVFKTGWSYIVELCKWNWFVIWTAVTEQKQKSLKQLEKLIDFSALFWLNLELFITKLLL